MIKTLTYQKRLRLILMLAGIFAFAIYQMAISDTVELVQKKNEVKKSISENLNAPEQVKALKIRLKKIEQLIGKKEDTKGNVHQQLLGSITSYTKENRLILKSFPQPYSMVENGYNTATSIVTVEGDFIPLLKFSNYLEHNYQGGKIVAMDFKVTKDLRSRRRILRSTIYLQTVKAIKHEFKT